MWKKLLTSVIVAFSCFLVVMNSVQEVSAVSERKGSFYFNLNISRNDGIETSGKVIKTDSAGYGAATVHSHDLVDSDRVYFRILKGNWWTSPATGYYRVYGSGTTNMYYHAGKAVYRHQYVLEGDSDKHNASLGGIWEP